MTQNLKFKFRTRCAPSARRAPGHSPPYRYHLAGPWLEDEFLTRAVVTSIDGVPVPVIDVSNLAILKVLAGRPKDVEDVLAMLEPALGQSDLLTAQAQLRASEI